MPRLSLCYNEIAETTGDCGGSRPVDVGVRQRCSGQMKTNCNRLGNIMAGTDREHGGQSGERQPVGASETDTASRRGVKRRRIVKGASIMAPAILTLHSGRAWAASTCQNALPGDYPRMDALRRRLSERFQEQDPLDWELPPEARGLPPSSQANPNGNAQGRPFRPGGNEFDEIAEVSASCAASANFRL